jgi:hypothetical protein
MGFAKRGGEAAILARGDTVILTENDSDDSKISL